MIRSFFHYTANWGSDTESLKLRKQILGSCSKMVKPLERTRNDKAKIPQGVDSEYENTVAVEALKRVRQSITHGTC